MRDLLMWSNICNLPTAENSMLLPLKDLDMLDFLLLWAKGDDSLINISVRGNRLFLTIYGRKHTKSLE